MYQWIYLECTRENGSGKMPSWLLKADDDFLLNVDNALKVAGANPHLGLM
jgi:hypothetical protein